MTDTEAHKPIHPYDLENAKEAFLALDVLWHHSSMEREALCIEAARISREATEAGKHQIYDGLHPDLMDLWDEVFAVIERVECARPLQMSKAAKELGDLKYRFEGALKRAALAADTARVDIAAKKAKRSKKRGKNAKSAKKRAKRQTLLLPHARSLSHD